jgi:hypothetical protein
MPQARKKRVRNTSSPGTLRAMVASMTGMSTLGRATHASPTSTMGRVEGSMGHLSTDVENIDVMATTAVEGGRKRHLNRERVMADSARLLADLHKEKALDAAARASTGPSAVAVPVATPSAGTWQLHCAVDQARPQRRQSAGSGDTLCLHICAIFAARLRG